MSKRLSALLGALVITLGLTACERKNNTPTEATKSYSLKGKVVKVEKSNKRVEVAHEKVEGFMEAMTMPFAVKDDAHFDQLQVGDQITATLIYSPADNRYWLENIAISKPQ